DLRPRSECCLACRFDKMRRLARDLPGASSRVGTGDIEIAKGGVTKPMRGRCVPEYPLDHQLCRTVGTERRRGRVLWNGHCRWLAVNGGLGREYELANAVRHAGFD